VVEVKLYLLERIGDTDYDEHVGFVIRAPNAKTARELAAGEANSFYDGPTWLDPSRSTCRPLKDAGAMGVILADFIAG
jgi:hypothetical protein